jgi:AbrB family looped-hinge helix DNA binding protein
VARATLSTKGQVVLPQAIRVRLGLLPGSELEVTTEGDAVILRRVSRFRRVTLDEVIGCVPYDGPALSIEEMNTGITEMLRAQASKD